MRPADYAALAATFGAKVVARNGVYWRRVRPFFYRPLLPLEPLDPQSVMAPCGWPGGFQFVLPDATHANSTINFLIFDDVTGYSLDTLNRHRQKQINKARECFTVRRIFDVDELKARAYHAYLAFYRRTGYQFKSDRTSRAGFDRWAETFRKFPQTILLGAYSQDALAAVSVAYWVGPTLIYSSVFSDTEAMKKNVASLLFHELRILAAAQPGITQILARPYQGGNNLDRFYLDRGSKLVRLPARLVLNPAVRCVLQLCLPRQFAHLRGD